MRVYLVNKWAKSGFDRFEIILASIYIFILSLPALRSISVENDFDIFYAAAKDLSTQRNLYTQPYLYGMWYYYSPLFAALLYPFTAFPIQILKVVWMCFSFFMIFRCLRHILSIFSVPENNNGKWFLVAAAVVSYHPLYLNLLHGQMTILIVWSCLESMKALENSNFFRAGAWLAIGINIKVIPIFLYYYLFIKRQWKILLYSILFLILLVLIPYVFFNYTYHTHLILGWLKQLNPLNREHIYTVGEGGFTDFASLCLKYLTSEPIPTENPANLMSLSHIALLSVQMVYRLLIMIVTAWWILRLLPKRLQGIKNTYAEYSAILLTIPSAFPHQRDYSFMLCIPALILIVYYLSCTKIKFPKWFIFFFILTITISGSLIFFEGLGHQMRQWIYHSRIVGFGTLLMIPLFTAFLLLLKPTNELGANK